MSEALQLGTIEIEKTTAEMGGNDVDADAFDIKSKGKPVSWVQACWNGEVLKGLALKFHGDDTRYTVGDWNNSYSSEYHRSTMEIAIDDPLANFKVSTSYYGYKSVRGIFVQKRSMSRQTGDVWWSAGNITDPFSFFEVSDRYWMGIWGKVNRDKFINSLGLYVSKKN